jgi:hypothetical protein
MIAATAPASRFTVEERVQLAQARWRVQIWSTGSRRWRWMSGRRPRLTRKAATTLLLCDLSNDAKDRGGSGASSGGEASCLRLG